MSKTEQDLRKIRVIAFYLPQYHPIKENDEWWGTGFTEWVNVVKAKPLFKGHYQPRIPADLGFYDLRIPEIREQQVYMAKEAGIEGFCYWHYWFGNGKKLLEMPFNEVLQSGKPNFPFCLGWANHSWTNKTWNVGKKYCKEGVLIEQTYPGYKDDELHFDYVLPAFKDKRYIRVDGKPLFLIYDPFDNPNISQFICNWVEMAKKNGLKGIHFVGMTQNLSSLYKGGGKSKYANKKSSSEPYYRRVLELGFDAVNSRGQTRAEIMVKGVYAKNIKRLINKYFDGALIDIYKYEKIIKHLYVEEDSWVNVYPTIIPNWDRSPRSGKKALIWHECTPELFGKSIDIVFDIINKKPFEHRILFLKSWNEWGEGNYVEPDIKYGKKYLEILKSKIIL